MQLEQSFVLTGTPADLWPSFKDLALLVACLPGASTNGPVDNSNGVSAVALRFEVRLGPIAAVFVGNGKLTSDDDGLNGSFEGSAVDRKTNSRVSGVARFSLSAVQTPAAETTDTETKVQVDIDYSLAGPLAQFNRAGIVHQLADALTAEFANRLQTRVSRSQPDEQPAQASPELAPSTQAAALNPLALVWSAVRQQLAKLIARLRNKATTRP